MKCEVQQSSLNDLNGHLCFCYAQLCRLCTLGHNPEVILTAQSVPVANMLREQMINRMEREGTGIDQKGSKMLLGHVISCQ